MQCSYTVGLKQRMYVSYVYTSASVSCDMRTSASVSCDMRTHMVCVTPVSRLMRSLHRRMRLAERYNGTQKVWHAQLFAHTQHPYCLLLAAVQVIKAREFWFDEPFVSREEAKNLRKAGVPKFQVLVTTFEIIVKEVNQCQCRHMRFLCEFDLQSHVEL